MPSSFPRGTARRGLPPISVSCFRLPHVAALFLGLALLSITPAGAVSRVFPEVRILTPEGDAFSPNGDGSRDILRFELDVRGGKDIEIVDWDLHIFGAQGLVRTYVPDLRVHRPAGLFGGEPGTSEEAHRPPSVLLWDGRDEKGKIQPDGRYRLELRVTYSYNHIERRFGREITIDTSLPAIALKPVQLVLVRATGSDGQLMMPVGEILIEQTAVSEPGLHFSGHIIDGAGRIVESRNWDVMLPAKIAWNGIMTGGEPAPPGVYRYELEWHDGAGNRKQTGCYQLQVLAGPLLPVRLNAASFFVDQKGMSARPFGSVSVQHTGKERPIFLRVEQLEGRAFRDSTWQEISRFRTAPVVNLATDQNIFGGLHGGGLVRIVGLNERGLPVTTPVHFFVDSAPPVLSLRIEGAIRSPASLPDRPLRLLPGYSSVTPLASWSLTCYVDTGRSRTVLREWRGEGILPPEVPWIGDLDTYALSGGERLYFEFQALNAAGRSARVTSGPLVTKAVFVPVHPRSSDLRASLTMSDLFGENGFSREGEQLLDEAADVAKELDRYEVRVRAFVSFQGEEEENLMRSERIARKIRDGLVQRGVPARSVSYRGEGETDLLSESEDDFSTYRNNRIVIELHRVATKP